MACLSAEARNADQYRRHELPSEIIPGIVPRFLVKHDSDGACSQEQSIDMQEPSHWELLIITLFIISWAFHGDFANERWCGFSVSPLYVVGVGLHRRSLTQHLRLLCLQFLIRDSSLIHGGK